MSRKEVFRILEEAVDKLTDDEILDDDNTPSDILVLLKVHKQASKDGDEEDNLILTHLVQVKKKEENYKKIIAN